MSDDTVVTAADVARLAGVGRAAVSNWRRRYPDFPQPVEGTAASPKFKLVEVDQWLRTQGKRNEPAPREELWRALDAGRDETDLFALLADTATYLTDIPDLPAEVVLPAEVRSALDKLTGEARSDLVEELCTQVFGLQQRQHLVTPPALAELMASLAHGAATVLDPACGPGGLLLAAADHGARFVAGQELNPSLARLAQARAKLYADAGPAVLPDDELGDRPDGQPDDRPDDRPGVPPDGRTEVRTAAGDSLRADAFPDLRADAVLCAPPLAVREWGHDELGLDPRWEYGLPPKGDSELAWLQHCLTHVRPGGEVVLLLPAGVAFRRSGRSIRQALLRRGALRAVLALPGGVLMSTGVQLHLWVLRAPDSTVTAGPVLLLDATRHQPERRGQVDWPAIRESVLTPWREFAETGTVAEVAGRQRVIEPIELLDEEVDLTPARHLPVPAPRPDVDALARTRDQLREVLGRLGSLLPEVQAAESTFQGSRATTTVHELARAGALTLQQAVGRVELEEDADGPPVLTGRDVTAGAEPSLRLAEDPPRELAELRPGDLVVPLLAAGDGRFRPQLITGGLLGEDGLLLGPNLQLIRVDPDRLDPEFLAGQISALPAARASSSTVSGIHRLDVRRVEIPVLDLAAQRRLGEHFHRLRAFRDGLGKAGTLGTELADQIADGLATGTLTHPQDVTPGPVRVS